MLRETWLYTRDEKIFYSCQYWEIKFVMDKWWIFEMDIYYLLIKYFFIRSLINRVWYHNTLPLDICYLWSYKKYIYVFSIYFWKLMVWNIRILFILWIYVYYAYIYIISEYFSKEYAIRPYPYIRPYPFSFV